MAASYYEVYQLIPGDKTQDYLYRPLSYLKKHGMSVRSWNYEAVFRETLTGSETVKMIRDKLENDDILLGSGRALAVSDVIAVTNDGLTFAYYVDSNRIILIPDFFTLPSSASTITLETTGYMIEGRKGSWMTVDAMMIDGRMYYLMLSEVYKRDAPYVILDEHGTLIGNDPQGFTDESIAALRETVRQAQARRAIEAKLAAEKATATYNRRITDSYQKYSENGEYLRTAELSTEQNYDMIDGRINNTDQPSVSRRSVLDRLHEKQTGLGTPQQPELITDEIRQRDN